MHHTATHTPQITAFQRLHEEIFASLDGTGFRGLAGAGTHKDRTFEYTAHHTSSQSRALGALYDVRYALCVVSHPLSFYVH